jgi:hypothetical protein
VIIKNEFTNIELTSPVYFVKDTTCHIQLPQQVSPKSTVKTNFITGMDQDTLGGALLYHLKKEDASISAQLLVIWGCDYGYYSDSWIIDHGSAFVWNEDKLKKLYEAYEILGLYISPEHYLLNDDTRLEVTCHQSYEFSQIEVTISEEEEEEEEGNLSYPMKPLYVDPNR